LGTFYIELQVPFFEELDTAMRVVQVSIGGSGNGF
jgi:hypothetical protein